MKNFKLILVLISSISLFSCATTKTKIDNPVNEKQRKIVYVSVKHNQTSEDKFVDSCLLISIENSNLKHKNLEVLIDTTANHSNQIVIDCSKVRFVKEGWRVTGYVVSTLGLIAAPIVVLSNSGGKAFLAFWYFPEDKADFRASYYNWDTTKRLPKRVFLVRSGALFTSKSKRSAKLHKQLLLSFDSFFKVLNKRLK